MATRIVLQIDGGGIRGITPAVVLAQLESDIRAKYSAPTLKLRDKLNLCCGTSTGAIMAGMVCAGVDANDIRNFYTINGVSLFKNSKNPWFTRLLLPKYKRAPFVDQFADILKNSSALSNGEATLQALPDSVIFMATAYNLSSYRTHFIKSDDPIDKQCKLKDVIAWSGLSAAYYFGKFNEPNYVWQFVNADSPPKTSKRTGAVFQDGGQGTQNCTLGFALTEIMARGWDCNDKVIVISLGTGNKTKLESYDCASKTSDIGQAIKYLVGQARDEATPIQILAARYVESMKGSNIKIFRLDYEANQDYELDDTDHANYYEQNADSIVKSSEYADLMASL